MLYSLYITILPLFIGWFKKGKWLNRTIYKISRGPKIYYWKVRKCPISSTFKVSFNLFHLNINLQYTKLIFKQGLLLFYWKEILIMIFIQVYIDDNVYLKRITVEYARFKISHIYNTKYIFLSDHWAFQTLVTAICRKYLH